MCFEVGRHCQATYAKIFYIFRMPINVSLICYKDNYNYQISYFLRCLDQAELQRLSKIIFIHGIGNGVLKSELRRKLQSMGYEFYDASLSRYGFGATAVVIK